MTEEIKRGRGRPRKNKEVETSSAPSSTADNTYEFNSYTSRGVSEYIFGLDIFEIYEPKEISAMIKSPMVHNEQLRKLSNQLYSANGLLTQCIDYCTALPTLDNVVIPRGKSKTKRKTNKTLMESALRSFHHKEIMRDALYKSMIDGVSFYYCVFTNSLNDNKKTMSDYDVENILEINELGINMSVVPLPTNFTKIVGRKNSSYVLAFNLRYFEGFDQNELERKLRLYPQEIRDGWNNFNKRDSTMNNWLILDNSKTIVSKIRSKLEEAWGRPLCLAAIKNILYSSYFQDTCRGTLDEINNRIIYQTLPQGKDPGSCALTKKQQTDQHEAVKGAVLTKNDRNSTSFFTVSAGTKIDQIKSDVSLLDEKNSSYINDQIGIDLGFMANLVSGTGSGNFASQQNNLQLLLSEVFMWMEPITEEFVKVINQNVIKDSGHMVSLYYLPCSIITRKDFTQQMKDLYLQGKGSLTAWIASTGINSEAYFELMNTELDEDIENKYPVHMTSFTASEETNKAGRPGNPNSTNENTQKSISNGSNAMPSPSDNK
ncbi:hypothetical protein AALB39_04450 [Lachnospiraceae bacterium 54-53]